jgi:hypothetical protein
MKFSTAVSALAILGATHATDLSVSTDKVTASFMGASGGLKLMNIETEGYLQVSQEKIEEVTPDGSKCNGAGCMSINVAGQNDWSALETVEVDPNEVGDDKTTVTSTTFTVVEDGVTFNLMAHVSNREWTETDPVPCSECAAEGAGPCQNAGDNTCADYETVDGVTTCPLDYAECTQTVELKSNELKFSMMLTGATLKDAVNNKIRYGLSIKDKSSDADGEDADGEAKTGEVKFGDGEVTYPSTGVMVGGDAAEREVPVEVTSTTQGSKFMLEFVFEAPAEGETFYYDPTLSVTGSAAKAGAAGLGMMAVLAIAGVLGM